MFGYAGSSESVRLEKVARNRCNPALADVDGDFADSVIDKDGPAEYFSTLPVTPILRALEERHIASVTSEDAGSYVCNTAFYRLMELSAPAAIEFAGFVHVPKAENYQAAHHRAIDYALCVSVVVGAVTAELKK
jgi:pyroglutamyl-peptidase